MTALSARARRVLPAVHEQQNLDESRHAAGALRARQEAGASDVAELDWGLDFQTFGPGWPAVRCAAFPDLESANFLARFDPAAPGALDALDAADAWARAVGAGLHVRVHADDANPQTTAELTRRGFTIAEAEAWMACPVAAQPDRLPDPLAHPLAHTLAEPSAQPSVRCDAPGVRIREVADADELEVWISVLLDGWGVPEPRRPAARAAMLGDPERRAAGGGLAPAHWTRFLAEVDGEAAGEALLTLEDPAAVTTDVGELRSPIAYLADAAVLPAARGRGVQRRLIEARLAKAHAAGAALAFAGATYGSVSHANMGKAGMSLAHVTHLWLRPPV